jgi:hypothetical protein
VVRSPRSNRCDKHADSPGAHHRFLPDDPIAQRMARRMGCWGMRSRLSRTEDYECTGDLQSLRRDDAAHGGPCHFRFAKNSSAAT